MSTSVFDAWITRQAINTILFRIFESPPEEQQLLLLVMAGLFAWLDGERSLEALLEEFRALGAYQVAHVLKRSEEQMQ